MRTPPFISLLYLLILTLTGGGTSWAETAPEVPRLVFEEDVHDFGIVYRGERASHKFIARNTGGGRLDILNIRPSCGCTAAVTSQNAIPPGGLAEIEVVFKSETFTGAVAKTVIVDSNDPKNPHYTLTIKAEVIEEIAASPRRLWFEQIKQGRPLEKEVEVKALTDLVLEISKVECRSKFLEVRHRKGENAYILEVKVKKDAPLGKFDGDIIVFTNSKRQPTLTVPFSGEIISEVSVFPSIISYGVVSRGEEAVRQILITIHERNVRLERLETVPDFLRLRSLPRGDGLFHRVEIVLSKDAPIGRLEGTLKIYTTSKDQPLITVPVYAMVKEG